MTSRAGPAGDRPDRILLAGMAFQGRHGVAAAERDVAQPFAVDIALELDLAPAGAADDLALTVDYALVHADVRAIVEGPSVLLLETLADRIAQGPIPLAEALPIARQIADALEAAQSLAAWSSELTPTMLASRRYRSRLEISCRPFPGE